jgi:hypothetical protein
MTIRSDKHLLRLLIHNISIEFIVAKMIKKTIDEFKKDAIETHGLKYVYDKVNYCGSHVKVEIICPKHGSFFQVPGAHINGTGCYLCSLVAKSMKQGVTLEEYIIKARNLHDNRYDYSLLNYENFMSSNRYIPIICMIHGKVDVYKATHIKLMNGKGHCPKCTEQQPIEYIKKVKKLNYPNHNYDKTVFINASKKVCITCNLHGDYFQRAAEHYRYQGCKACRYIKSSKTNSKNGDLKKIYWYRQLVISISNMWYRKEHYRNIINPKSLKRSKQLHLDHIFSIREAYEYNISPLIVAHYSNLQLISGAENIRKHSKSEITRENLLEKFNQADQKAPDVIKYADLLAEL